MIPYLKKENKVGKGTIKRKHCICDFTVGNFNKKSYKIIRQYVENEDTLLLYTHCSMIETLLVGVFIAIIACMHFI